MKSPQPPAVMNCSPGETPYAPPSRSTVSARSREAQLRLSVYLHQRICPTLYLRRCSLALRLSLRGPQLPFHLIFRTAGHRETFAWSLASLRNYVSHNRLPDSLPPLRRHLIRGSSTTTSVVVSDGKAAILKRATQVTIARL